MVKSYDPNHKQNINHGGNTLYLDSAFKENKALNLIFLHNYLSGWFRVYCGFYGFIIQM